LSYKTDLISGYSLRIHDGKGKSVVLIEIKVGKRNNEH
jgi:hypothetical protein